MVITTIHTKFAGVIITDAAVGDMVIVFAGKGPCINKKPAFSAGFFI
jgi:hypothetical protein